MLGLRRVETLNMRTEDEAGTELAAGLGVSCSMTMSKTGDLFMVCTSSCSVASCHGEHIPRDLEIRSNSDLHFTPPHQSVPTMSHILVAFHAHGPLCCFHFIFQMAVVQAPPSLLAYSSSILSSYNFSAAASALPGAPLVMDSP